MEHFKQEFADCGVVKRPDQVVAELSCTVNALRNGSHLETVIILRAPFYVSSKHQFPT